ncbi:MAG: DUF1573 domain-containing protein [Bacteroidales bacterium]|nr:DUF1573 domain-containing protein [Bacteroidales bacterium]
MKKLFLLSLFAVMAFGVSAQEVQEQAPVNGPKISFNKMVHDYGVIEKDGNGNCVFEFTNNGTEPLILSNVRASCGCTTPQWTKAPIMPGQTGTINVRYNTSNVGGFNKSITVTSNAVDNPRVVLKIKGNVQGPSKVNNN